MTTKLEKIADPVSFYNNPLDVDKDGELSPSEKITLLKNWIDDIKLRQTAEAENMGGEMNGRYFLAEIERLLWKYEQQQKQD